MDPEASASAPTLPLYRRPREIKKPNPALWKGWMGVKGKVPAEVGRNEGGDGNGEQWSEIPLNYEKENVKVIVQPQLQRVVTEGKLLGELGR